MLNQPIFNMLVMIKVCEAAQKLQRNDQVCEKRVQMQVKGVSELGVHLHGRR